MAINNTRRRKQPNFLKRFLLISLGVHLFVALVLLIGSLFQPNAVSAVSPSDDIDVEIVHQEAVGKADRRDFDKTRRTDNRQVQRNHQRPVRQVRRWATNGRRPSAPAKTPGSTVGQSPKGELPPCSLLNMRACKQPRKPKPDRYGSFWGQGKARPKAPRIISQAEAKGVALKRYADGGKLFSSTRGGQAKPDLGTVGLVDLAKGRVGGRSGRTACNPYRKALRGKRTLVLLVDTSVSIDAAHHTSEAVHCAAGAALAALGRGYLVEVLNFSTGAMHQPPTRDAEAIYRTLSFIQRKQTLLPPASRLVSSSGRPRDFVLVTDSAIGNLDWTLPAYTRAVKTHGNNRAILYLLGDGVVCSKCHFARNEICYECSKSSRETLVALEKAGFEPNYLDQPQRVAAIAARQVLKWVLP